MLKNRISTIARFVFQRKKFIILPLIVVPLCIAIYAFTIAPETYRAENRIAVLDNKTGTPMTGGSLTTGDCGKRIDSAVKRTTGREGITAVIANIDYLAANFPGSAEIQRKRRDALAEKQRACGRLSVELQKKIDETDDRLRIIADRESELQRLAERGENEPANEKIRQLVQSRRQSRDEELLRLDKMVDTIRKGLTVGVKADGVTASFESDDPQLCKDVVDEALLALAAVKDDEIKFEKPAPAVLPVAPVKPNCRMLIALGLIAGAAVAAALLLFAGFADRSIRSAADAARRLGLPVLATLPRFFRTAKGVTDRAGFSARKAAAYITTTAAAALLVLAFAFDRETAGLVHQKLNKATVAQESDFHGPPSQNGTALAAKIPQPPVVSFAAEKQARKLAPPDMEIADPDATNP
jgi:Skp family chaperone for outer membrane proteins